MQTLKRRQKEQNNRLHGVISDLPSSEAICEWVDIISKFPGVVQPSARPKFFWVREDRLITSNSPKKSESGSTNVPNVHFQVLTSDFRRRLYPQV